GGRQRRRRRRRRRCHTQRRRAVHVRCGGHRADADLTGRRAPRPGLHRACAARRGRDALHGGRAGGRAEVVRDAGQPPRLAEGGAEVFYRGPIAKTIARAVREAGGWLGEDDLAAFEPEWREPVTITYRGRRIYSMPPPFSAFQMLETLNILEGYELQAWGHN